MPKGIPLTEEEQARRRKEICAAAVALFLKQGFNETAMREVAAAAGVGKSTLYDYFQTKDDILLSVVEEVAFDLNVTFSKIGRGDQPPPEKLRSILFAYLDYLAANEMFFMKLSQEVQRLAQSSLARVQLSRHAVQDTLRGVIVEGVQGGFFRPTDPLLAARILMAALSPVVYTTRPSGTRSQMMEEAVALLLNGLFA